jgi:uncharacterized SAM-binding protein YcdF (DUF218 family)
MAEFSKRRQGTRALRRASAAVLALAAWSALAWGAARWLVVSEPIERADAVAVLAGSETYLERAGRAAELYREGRAPRVLLTDDGLRGGWDAKTERNPLFVERAAEELRRAGVPEGSVEVLSPQVTSTYEEAALMREQAEARGWRSLLVVTSGYQSRRALWTLRRVFEGSGVRVGLEAVEPGRQAPRAALWWCSPLGWKLVPGEYLKLAYYRLRY